MFTSQSKPLTSLKPSLQPSAAPKL